MRGSIQVLTFRMRHLSQLANGKFLYRRAIPQRLRPLLGKREFKRILGSTEEDALRAYPSYHRYIDDTLKTLKPLGQAKDQVSFSEVRKAYDALGLDTLTEGTEDEQFYKSLFVEELTDPYAKHEAGPDGYETSYPDLPKINETLATLITKGERFNTELFRITDAFEAYLKDKQKPEGKYRDRQSKRLTLVQQRFLDAIGRNLPVVKLRRKHAKQTRDFLLDQPMEPATVNRYLADIKAVLSYATRENDIPYTNPFASISLEIEVSDHQQREPLPDHVADLVFDDLQARKNQDLFDLIRLLDLTGGRLAEISCLRQDEVVLEVPIPYIDIKQRSDRRLKNDWSVRTVPLTQTAQEAARSALARNAGNNYLFPVFDSPRGSDNASGRLNKVIKKYRSSPKQVTHSLRHGFRDRIRANAIPLELANAIEGRRYSQGEEARYGGGYTLEQKLEALRKINGEE